MAQLVKTDIILHNQGSLLQLFGIVFCSTFAISLASPHSVCKYKLIEVRHENIRYLHVLEFSIWNTQSSDWRWNFYLNFELWCLIFKTNSYFYSWNIFLIQNTITTDKITKISVKCNGGRIQIILLFSDLKIFHHFS